MTNKIESLVIGAFLATFLAGSICASVVIAAPAQGSQTAGASQIYPSQSNQGNAATPSANAQSALPATPPAAAGGSPFRNQPPRMASRALMYYESVWGIEPVSVKAVESGEIIRFTWRVLNPDLAKPLNDKKVDPVLIDPVRGVKLVVPSLEQVGMLRQAPNKIEEGKSYWMAFSNSGRPVKRGDRVIVQIGKFRADGLIVE